MKQLTKKITLLVVCLGFALPMLAQQVRGVVSDVNGEPLTGVTVIVENTTTMATTDLDGNYTIANAVGKNLIFSFIGKKQQIIAVGDRAVLDVVLEDESTSLDELVVVGYATVKRRDLIGSVASVGNEKLTEMPVTTVSQALSGKMAGVSVLVTEGDPDADIKIRVRGGGSITQDNSPLYIVDGFPVESINDIPSADIQSIDVLKDAFSTAIYGSRGANGVVIVTTKGGGTGKLSVNYNAYYGVKQIANKEALVPMDPDNYVKFQYELAKVRDNVVDYYEPYFGSFSDIDLYSGIEGNDWVQQVFGQTGTTFNHNISLSGGGEKVNWTAGYSHIGDNAIMSGSNYKRDNLNLKARFQPVKSLTFDFNVRYSKTNVRGSGANSINDNGSTSGNGRLKHAISYTPIPISGAIEGVDEEADYGDNAPPLLSVADNDSKRLRSNWTANGSMTWEIIDNLNFKIDGGIDDYRQTDDRFYGLTTYYVANTATIKNQPAARYTDFTRTKYRNTNTLQYNFEKLLKNEDHKLDVLLGQEYILTQSNTLNNWVEGYPDFFDADMAWNFMASGTATSINNFYSPDDQLLSFFGRANYEFKGKYSVSATVRADGSSKFAAGNQWGYFPSAAASWKISEEGFLKDAEWIDNLKLRYSYGTAGNNNIPSGLIKQEYAAYTSTWISQGTTYWTTTKDSDGKTVMSNPDLKWETTTTHNLGFDFSFFKDRLNGSVEVYQNNTKDLLIKFPTAGSGYDNQYRNLGETQNRGLEITLGGHIVQTANVGLSVSGNISFNKNKVLSLGGLDQIEAVSYWASTEIGTDYMVTVGGALGDMYGYKTAGRYEVNDFTYDGKNWVVNSDVPDASAVIGSSYMRPGALKLEDINGDGKITVDDRTVIGNASPLFQGGFNLTGYAYGFDFSANFTFMYGNEIYNANKVEFTSSRKFNNRNLLNSMDVDKRWTNVDWTTGELITDPNQLASANARTTMWSPLVGSAVFHSWAVEDGSFLRLSSATVGYTLPEKWTRKVAIKQLRVYATGTNLFCLTNYTGYDPEVDTRRSTPLTPGVDYSAYPKSTGCVFGINITF